MEINFPSGKGLIILYDYVFDLNSYGTLKSLEIVFKWFYISFFNTVKILKNQYVGFWKYVLCQQIDYNIIVVSTKHVLFNQVFYLIKYFLHITFILTKLGFLW